ncbi:hypothetical protein TanjilG_12008 [Lupinus angustifolius]|uniref:Uncharacterized protein n=1 Tax=Lupinus angustifolius TaxID=3871 RepID=A0A1J7HSH9_LUPAN|nr:PREDICTED: transcription factor MYB36-like [Lupinus angustifolius]OIW03411.1 hypothetical protein TanjilG_12008 [Lupinus angustifolius]
MGRAPCCDKANVKRGPWSPEEDATLKSYLQIHGTGGNWIALPTKAGLRRCGKSCRLRWLNYLRPDIKHGGFTEEEDNIICTLYVQMGSKWSAIASQLPGRTDNDVKNYWNTKLKRKLMAGKVCHKKLNDNDTLPSTTLLTQKAQSLDFHASQNQNSMPNLSTDACSEFNIDEKNMGFGLIHQFYSPQVKDVVKEVGASSRNNNHNHNPLMSLSQEGSSISDSSSIAVENNCVLLPEHAGNHESAEQVLMDFGFEFPYDLTNNLNCHERFGEFSPSGYSEWVDFSYVDIKPHLLNKN